MKLLMTLLVRDEADIVASNIDFHLDRGVDFIIATDNLSVDGTTEILRQYERRGVLRYISQPEDNYAQNRWVTHMARLACTEYAADWVINSDADEFWWPEEGDLKHVLGAVAHSCDTIGLMRANFVPQRMASSEFFADAMTIRARHALNSFGQPLQPKVCHRAFPDIEVAQGNHSVLRRGETLAAIAAPITILHFPQRSYRQYANKVAKGGAAYARNPDFGPQVGHMWRYCHELWRRGELEAHYRGLLLDDEAIDAGLLSGRLVHDDRLKRFFAARRKTCGG